MKKCLALLVGLFAVAGVFGQSRSKPVKRTVKQPRDVVEAYRVCGDFQRLLAEDLDFDRAFEATFTMDPARRRKIADSELSDIDFSQLDDATLVEIYKNQVQLLILMLPLMLTGGEDAEAELVPPPIKSILERKPPNDPQRLQAYAAELKSDVADFRSHVRNLASKNPDVAKNLRGYKNYLQKPLASPNRVVKPLTAYSRGKVLPADAKYYQINDCAVIREGDQMRLIGYTFFKFRW